MREKKGKCFKYAEKQRKKYMEENNNYRLYSQRHGISFSWMRKKT